MSRFCPSSVLCITEIMQKNLPLSVKICQNISDICRNFADQNVIFKIFLITVQIMLKICSKSIESLSNNCANSVRNMFKTCPQSVYNTTQTVEFLSNLVNFVDFSTLCWKYVRNLCKIWPKSVHILLKICSKTAQYLFNVCQ